MVSEMKLKIIVDEDGVHPRWLLLSPYWLIAHLRVLRAVKKLRKELYGGKVK
jgi:hypothetical protein